MRHLNNKGYMLVEIVLAFAIALGIVYFMLDLTINLKNKNDDLMVIALTQTDRTIIMNGLMSNIDDDDFCSNIEIDKGNNIVKYDGKVIDILNKYALVGDFVCGDSSDSSWKKIEISISVKQLPDENFNIYIKYPKK